VLHTGGFRDFWEAGPAAVNTAVVAPCGWVMAFQVPADVDEDHR